MINDTYGIDDGNGETREVAEEITPAEEHPCEHGHMDEAGKCLDCGESCSGDADDELGTCQDTECPIHGAS
jgi:hypothetical protein